VGFFANRNKNKQLNYLNIFIDITQIITPFFRGLTIKDFRKTRACQLLLRIDLVYTRSTPPRWRVAVQLAGA